MATRQLSDTEIIERIREGEKHLFEELMIRYNQRLFRICMGIVRDRDSAGEIMQSAYVKAYENLDRFEGRSGFMTWITRILINEGLMYKRKARRVENMENTGDQLIEKKHPLSMVVNEELKQALERAIGRLPHKYRIVFIMREIEGMTIAETIGVLGITTTNVKVRLNRAKSLLRDDLSSYYRQADLYAYRGQACASLRERVMGKIRLLSY